MLCQQSLGEPSGSTPELEHRACGMEGGISCEGRQGAILIKALSVLSGTKAVVESLGLCGSESPFHSD
jgi:hypothetical protein